MNDETMPAFPPFIPAKPKGGVATEIAAANAELGAKAVDAVVKRQRKPREVQTEADNPTIKRRKKRKPRPATIPLDAIVGFAGLTTEEAEQVVNVCTALQTFPKGSRTRIAAALRRIFE